MKLLAGNTPIEKYEGIYVKREDLSCIYPGPGFSKMRGVAEHIKNRPEKYIGVLDTYHSKAGWAVAYICKHLNKKCINYWPRYKKDPISRKFMRGQQKEAKNLGAMLVSLQAGRSAILYHQAKKDLAMRHKKSYMMPNALKLHESVIETAKEVCASKLPRNLNAGTVIIPISSATIAAGVILGLQEMKKHSNIILHMGYSRSKDQILRYISNHGVDSSLFKSIIIIDEGYSYKDYVDFSCPFPCNKYYDLKTWGWLMKNKTKIKNPIIFWNIGE